MAVSPISHALFCFFSSFGINRDLRPTTREILTRIRERFLSAVSTSMFRPDSAVVLCNLDPVPKSRTEKEFFATRDRNIPHQLGEQLDRNISLSWHFVEFGLSGPRFRLLEWIRGIFQFFKV